MTDESLIRFLIEHEALEQAAAGNLPHMEAILARVSAEITMQAMRRLAAAKRDAAVPGSPPQRRSS